MSSAADPAIAALRAVHDELAGRVGGYSADDVVRPSAAAEWTVAQVLSHVGSGAEISLAALDRADTGSPPADPSFNQSVWDRWNAKTPAEQAADCLSADAALVERYEGLDDATRGSLRIDLPFLPEPIGLDLAGALRLNEQTLHAWDVAVADDTEATLNATAVPVLVDALSGPLSFLIGFIGKGADAGADPVVLGVQTTEPERSLTLSIGEKVALQAATPAEPDGELTLPAETLLRLLTGRLGPGPASGTTLTGPLDLPALRAVFPGF